MTLMRFSPVNLSRLSNFVGVDQLSGPDGAPIWSPNASAVLPTLPRGRQRLAGIPFVLGPKHGGAPRCLVFGTCAESVLIPTQGLATYVILAHFCNLCQDPEREGDLPGVTAGLITRVGEHLADYALVYADGREHRQPIRRRFEINDVLLQVGSECFAALPHAADEPVDPRGPSPRYMWGRYQTGVVFGGFVRPGRSPVATCWIYALANPDPERPLQGIRIEPTGADTFAIVGITLYAGQDHPLQRRKLETLRITLPEAVQPDSLSLSADLGTVARRYAVPSFLPGKWLAAPIQGWGEEEADGGPTAEIMVDVTASADATLKVGASELHMRAIYEKGRAETPDGRVHAELLTPQREWLHVSVVDSTTGRPTPVRIHFRSPDGRYLPPYGHRHEVNDDWFEDYGGDCKLGSTQYAYIDGRCQAELPIGEVYVEVCKGFEYKPVRQKIQIQPGQREVSLTIDRPLNWRERNWVTADTHVHFISPQTAWLEAKAEGVNLVNLLASQWGDLFTNVADFTGGLSGSSSEDTLVWVGTENRQHVLGHMSLLGLKGTPVEPMCAGGPSESYIGDQVWTTMAEWADACREREGLVVAPHFPIPYCEVVADIVLGKIDAVELCDFRLPSPDTYAVLEWYRFLNNGYRLSAVGGTDKMSASVPVGGVRTYAQLSDEEFNFANWAKAVRAGRTFTTTGPLLDLRVEGHPPGDELRLPAGGGTLAVEARAESMQPFHTLQVVANGKVVAAAVAEGDGRKCVLRANVRVGGSGWVAARCWGPDRVWQRLPLRLAAHTSPVYIVAGDRDAFAPSDATFMLTMLEGGLAWLDTLSIRADPERHLRNRKVFEDARAALHQRLHAAGMPH